MKVKKFLLLFSYLSLACIAQAMEKETFSYLESMPVEVKENILLTADTLKDAIANMQNLMRTNTGWNNFISDTAETARLITLLSKKFNVPDLYVAALLDTPEAAAWITKNATEKPNDIKKMFAAVRAFPIKNGRFAHASSEVKISDKQSFSMNYSNSTIVIYKLDKTGFDSSFGTNGIVSYSFQEPKDINYRQGIGIRQQQKFIFVGSFIFKETTPYIMLVRINSDGSLDRTFGYKGLEGLVVDEMPFIPAPPENIIILDNNQFALYGYSASYLSSTQQNAFFYVLLYDENGELLDTLILPVAK